MLALLLQRENLLQSDSASIINGTNSRTYDALPNYFTVVRFLYDVISSGVLDLGATHGWFDGPCRGKDQMENGVCLKSEVDKKRLENNIVIISIRHGSSYMPLGDLVGCNES
jgi:hypothetical protein